jgi:hypothetical protein
MTMGEEVAEKAKRRGGRREGWKVRWTKAMKQAFLDHLAATCNVKEASAAVDVDPGSAYGLRRRDASFARDWAEAVAQGYTMLETLLIGHALAGGGGTIETGCEALGPLDRDLALKLLAFHRQGSPRSTQRRGPKTVATREETNAAILTRLRALTAAQAREDAAAKETADGEASR